MAATSHKLSFCHPSSAVRVRRGSVCGGRSAETNAGADVIGIEIMPRAQTCHPLDPLSAAEISVAVSTVRAAGDTPEVRDGMRFIEVVLLEPDKTFVALADAYFFPPFQSSLMPRTKGGLLVPSRLPTRRARLIDAQEYADCESVVKNYPSFIEAMKRRGIDDMDLVMVDPWCVGYHSEADAPSRRLAKPLVIEFEDRKVVPLPPADPLRNYTAGETRGGVDRSDVKPLQIIQPDDTSFRVDGNYVQWKRDRRSIAHRLSFVEMVVPYGDPNDPHYRKDAFDAGEDGLGKNAHSLKRDAIDGKIEAEVKLTGILSLGALQPGESRKYGTTITPGLYAPVHQHFFVARMNMSVDCKPGEAHNQIVEVNVKVEEPGKENVQNNAFYAEETLLRYVLIVRNTRTANRTGKLTGYKLVPGPNCLPLSGPEAKFLRRAAFLKHNLWVTQYAPGEDFPGGEFPNQNPRVGEGLASWVKQERSLEESDIVLWYVFGITHVPRLEDWPVMPVEHIGFMLQPHRFFNCSPAVDVPPPRGCDLESKDSDVSENGVGKHTATGLMAKL
ncbi:hypothetical protein RND71_006351 [Anisodus tanguticus]|uniref:Amine oxidase n=1 Tax=Anisodus tanguticus TaxID=243964 RepID=A0AAE1SRS5_9SOLA|nr:hypothetical protein RND71_006351 [Anisodus tanguticus]